MKRIFPLFILACAIQTANAGPINSLDCSDDEIAKYVDQSGFQKKRGFNTIPNTTEYIPAYAEKVAKENGPEAADQCNTIFSDGVDMSKASDVFGSMQDILNDPVGAATKAGEAAQERVSDVYNGMSEQLKKGVCDRLSTKGASKTVGDQVDTLYKSQTKDTALSGTKVNTSDILGNGGGIGGGQTTADPSDAVGKNFTYNIIKNQLGNSSSSIAKLLDFSNPKQGGAIVDYGSDIVNDNLDSIVDSIFGK
jgi:hypothetical protein